MKINKITKLFLILLMGMSSIALARGGGGHGGGFGGGGFHGGGFGGGRGFGGGGFHHDGYYGDRAYDRGGFYGGGLYVDPLLMGTYADDEYADYDPDYNESMYENNEYYE